MQDLLIVGASARAATQSAIASGYRVIAADLFSDLDLSAMAACHLMHDYHEDLPRIRRQYPELPLIYTGALENYPELLGALAIDGPLWGSSDASVRKLRDPAWLRATFDRHGLPFPECRFERPLPSSRAWLQKPLRSAGGFGVRAIDSAREEQLGADYVYQSLIEGLPMSAAFVAGDGEAHLLGVTEMLVGLPELGARDYIYAGSLLRRPSRRELMQWTSIGRVLAKESEVVGVFGVDAVFRAGEVVPIEVNPRYTASMEVLERVSAVPIMELHCQACQNLELERLAAFRSVTSQSAGKVILYAKAETWIPHAALPELPDAVVADIPHPGQHVPVGRPLLTLIGTAPDETILRNRLMDRSQTIYAWLQSQDETR